MASLRYDVIKSIKMNLLLFFIILNLCYTNQSVNAV